jgi:predicted dehydrogenase
LSRIEKPIGIAVVGCGSIGPTHAGVVRDLPEARLVAVVDIVPERAHELAQKFGSPRVYTSLDAALTDPDVQLITIGTPSGMHAVSAIQALRAGRHVIVEKPMEVSLQACDQMIDAADQTGRVLSVISQHRFDPATQLAKKLITEGAIGDIVLACANVHWWRTQAYYDSGDWRGTWKLDGGGALMNQGVHTVDLLQWLAGDVDEVVAHTRTAAHERIEVEDIAAALLKFKNGAVGTLTATTAAFDGYPVRIEIFGTQGSIVLEGDAVKRIVLKDGRIFDSATAHEHAVRVARGGTRSVRDDALNASTAHSQPHVRAQTIDPQTHLESATDSRSTVPEWRWGDAHRAQFRDVIHAIHSNTAPLVTPTAGRAPVAIIRAIYESAASGSVRKVSIRP